MGAPYVGVLRITAETMLLEDIVGDGICYVRYFMVRCFYWSHPFRGIDIVIGCVIARSLYE